MGDAGVAATIDDRERMIALAVQRRVMKVPAAIPPRSVVRLVRYDDFTPDWSNDLGREFRIGYYSRSDGLNTIWLVNDDGKYEQTLDRDALLKYFDFVTLSRKKDPYGRSRPALGRRR